MGKSTGSTTTKYELSPEQRQIMSSAMSQYMPGGQLPTSAPDFNYNSSPGLQQTGQNYVAPFSDPTKQAFAATEANFGAQRGTMDAAKGLTFSASGPAGQFQGGPDGWSTDSSGKANYHDFATGVAKYQNPHPQSVINPGLGFLDPARQRANLDTESNAIGKGSFGGTREAVRKSLNDSSFGAQAGKMISDNLNEGYKGAVSQYNTGFGQGQEALKYNTGVATGDRDARLASGTAMGKLAMDNQQLVGNDINALANVGGAIEGKDQAMRDAARADQMQDQTYGLNVGQALAGFSAPPSSTATQNVSSGSIWGSALGSGLSALAAFSDKRAKKNIEDANPDDALAEIRKLVPKKYDYTADAKSVGAPGGRRTGFMAQDLEKATGQPSVAMPGGYKGVDLHEHIGRLTQAVQALDQKLARRGKAA